MATTSDYTFHVRADKSIAETVFKRILEAEMHDVDEDVRYFEDEQGYGLYFYGYGNDLPESELREWLTDFSKSGVEIDWMTYSDDGDVWTHCSSFVKGREIDRLSEETYINDWKTAVLVGRAMNGVMSAIAKLPDAILNLDCDYDYAEQMTGYVTMFEILSKTGKLKARTQDVEKWDELLRWRGEYEESMFCDELAAQIEEAIEARKLLDRAGMNKPNRDIATI